MIQFIWIFLLLFGSSYLSTDSELSLRTKTKSISTVTRTVGVSKSIEALSNNASTDFHFPGRNGRDMKNARELRLLDGETLGGLTDCQSFEVGDINKREFYSPNYPNEYPSQITCTRVLSAASRDERVIVDFRDRFDLEPSENCKYDWLEVRDGAHGYSTARGKYCGHQFPEKIVSTGSDLWLRFVSDDNIEYKGFRAVYWFEKRNISEAELNEQPCEINKTESEGNFNISIGDIPQEQREKASKFGINCIFNIFVEEEKMVSLSWDEFNLQHPNDCELNYVNILEENSDTIKQRFCGAAAEPIQFTNNKVQIQFVVQKSAINSSFFAHFTPFRKSNNCTDEEFNCQDGNCIALSLQCNGINNCVTASDEDTEECSAQKERSFWDQLTDSDLLIILIVFFLILFGMCFTLIFNIVRKLVHDFSVIKEHVRQSRESQLNQLGRKTPSAILLTPMVTVLPNLPDNLILASENRATANVLNSMREDVENDGDVPTQRTFPNFIRKGFGFEKGMNGGPQYHHHNVCQTHRRHSSREYKVAAAEEEEEDGLVTGSGSESVSYMPMMRDNECQTRESLFFNPSAGIDFTIGSNSSPTPSSLSPLPRSGAVDTSRRGGHDDGGLNGIAMLSTPPPTSLPSIGFTTFGYENNQQLQDKVHRFRAEAVIEVERFKSPKHDCTASSDGRKSGKRPYSVQSTKSAPDVIVTH